VGFFIGLFVALQSTTPLEYRRCRIPSVPLNGVFIAKVWLKEAAPLLANSRVCSGIDWGCRWLLLRSLMTFTMHSVITCFWAAERLLFYWPYMWCGTKRWGRSLGALLLVAFMNYVICVHFGWLPVALIMGVSYQVQWLSQDFWGCTIFCIWRGLQRWFTLVITCSKRFRVTYDTDKTSEHSVSTCTNTHSYVLGRLYLPRLHSESRYITWVDWPFAYYSVCVY